MKLIATLAVFFLIHTCSAQDIPFTPINYKDAPAEAVNYLKTQKLKAKKAKWSLSPTGVYMADFQKKKQSKVAYYLQSTGMLLYKRMPIQLSELPPAVAELMTDRVKESGAKLFIFKSPYEAIYAISIPYGDQYLTKYFTNEGVQYDMKFK